MHARLCSFIKKDGMPCRAVAVSGRTHCLCHQRLHQRSPRQRRVRSGPIVRLGSLADRHSILMALSRVLQAVESGALGPQRAADLLQRIRHATDNLADRERLASSERPTHGERPADLWEPAPNLEPRIEWLH